MTRDFPDLDLPWLATLVAIFLKSRRGLSIWTVAGEVIISTTAISPSVTWSAG
jgi:hypothetical protein